MTPSIRQATPLDASEILLLCMEHNGDEHPLYGPITPAKVSAAMRSICQSIEEGFAFVATDPETGQLAGTIGGKVGNDWWAPPDERVVFQRWWYVRPPYRRGGEPAAGLMLALAGRARDCGMLVRFCDVAGAGHDRAMRRMMRRLGFQAIGTTFTSGVHGHGRQ